MENEGEVALAEMRVEWQAEGEKLKILGSRNMDWREYRHRLLCHFLRIFRAGLVL